MRRFLLMLLGSILLFGGSIQAAERDFSVAIDTAISEQRQPSNTAYYDLLLASGTTKELTFILTNHTDDDLRIAVNPSNATTSSSGRVTYQPLTENRAPTIQMTNYLQIAKTVVIPADGQKTVTATLTMPNTADIGLMAGGVSFTAVKAKQDINDKIQLAHALSYTIAVHARAQAQLPKVALSLSQPTAISLPNRTGIAFQINNKVGRFVNDLSGTASLTDIATNKPIMTATFKQISLAPNTSWPLTVSRKNKQLPPGKYRLAVHVKTSGLTQSWNQPVTVRMAHQEQQVRGFSVWVVGIGLISIGAIAAISYWVISKSQPNG